MMPFPALFLAYQAASAPTLKVGDPAPALAVSTWLKGKPVARFEKGKVYVVEFWATWCGPCKANMPHLSEVARKMRGKAEVIGVDVWERAPTTEADVKAFVAGMGDRMDYNVVRDDAAGAMSTTWLRAAGRNGIPSAFIVGRDGKIAWIGHPASRMPQVLEAVVADRYDPAAEAALSAKMDAERKAQLDAIAAYRRDAATDRAKADRDFAAFVAAHPEAEKSLASSKYQTLLQVDETAAYAYARELADGAYRNDVQGLYLLSAMIVRPLRPLKSPDLALAGKIAAQAAALPPTDTTPYVVTVLARTLASDGQTAKARETLQKELDRLQKTKGADADGVKAVKAALEELG